MADIIEINILSDASVGMQLGAGGSVPAKWDEWNAETRYDPLNCVGYDGSSYICLKANSGRDPEADVALGNGVKGEYWLLIAKEGAPFTYDMFTQEQLEALRGPQGEQGVPGIQGQPGKNGKSGVYVGSGEMPEGYYIQIDPSGDASGGYPGTGGSGSGENGATFYPHVDADGNLSWTNNGGLTNPATVNIRGPEGPQGQAGQKGETGDPGQTGPAGQPGKDGKDATINGVNALTIQGGDGIDATMSGSTLTIKAKTVEEWTFTLEDDSTVTKKVVLV